MCPALLHYIDRCYHHYDDFIVPKSGWFMTTWKKDTGQKDANELKATSMKQYLQCYSDAFDSPPNLRRMLCQDVSAAIEDISSKFTHLKDGYSCPVHSYGYSHPEPLNESSCSRLKSVRAKLCFVLGFVLHCNLHDYGLIHSVGVQRMDGFYHSQPSWLG